MEDTTNTTPADDRLTHRLAVGLDSLSEDLDELHTTLATINTSGLDTFDLPADEVREYIRATVTVVDAEFRYVTRLVEDAPADAVDVTYASSHIDDAEDGLRQAYEQFDDVVAPVPDALDDGTFDETEWQRFWGSGYGLSHARTVSRLNRTLNPPEPPAHVDETATEQSVETTDSTSDEATSDIGTSTAEETASAPETSPEPTETESQGDETEYAEPVEYISDPEGNEEPLGHDKRIGNGAIIKKVERTGVPDAPLCKNGDQTGKYLVTWESRRGEKYVSRVCASCIPSRARGIAPGFRFNNRGRTSEPGEQFVYADVGTAATNGGYTWREEHGIGSRGHRESLASIEYEVSGDSIRITVFDHISEHPREGIFTVDIDEWEGAIPIVDGKYIDEWLNDRGEQHYKRIRDNDGVGRHLVPIDQDQAVISRAKQAYREQNPDFEQPSGTINDYTPIVDDYIPRCSACGEIVAGITPDDAEPCEYCGCADSVWGGSTDTAEAETQTA